jgi:hypothetical protein
MSHIETFGIHGQLLVSLQLIQILASGCGGPSGQPASPQEVAVQEAMMCADPPCSGCPSGYVTCGDGCIKTTALRSDPNNCGACGVVCASGQCSAGSCVCPSGTTICGHACVAPVSFQSDPRNCGGCGVNCGTETQCVSGQCVHAPPMCPNATAAVAPGFPIWNVSLHHRDSDLGVVQAADLYNAVYHIASVTWNPDDLIVVLPSAPSYYNWSDTLSPCKYDGLDFLQQLRSYFPGHNFTFHQTNDPGNCVFDSNDCIGILCPYKCPQHPNNSGVILGANWTFTQAQGSERKIFPSNDPTQGGQCVNEADYFGDFGIQNAARRLSIRILTAQTNVGSGDVAARQIADLVNQGSVYASANTPTFVIGDFNGALGSGLASSFENRLSIWTHFGSWPQPPEFGAPNFASCAGFSGPDTNGVLSAGANFDGLMELTEVNLLPGQASAQLIPVGFRTEWDGYYTSAKIKLDQIRHGAEAAYFVYP